MNPAWIGAGVAGLFAVGAGVGDWRRRRRRDLDRIGWVDWPTVQVLAAIALAVLVSVALNS